MKIFHLNCGSMCPSKLKFKNKFLREHVPEKVICHCLLIETQNKLILVDTGLGLEDVKRAQGLDPVSLLYGIQGNRTQTAYEQVRALGFSPSDVTDLILTHLDFDHAGGIPDFKSTKVHVAKSELAAARARSSIQSKGRYWPSQIGGDLNWQEFELGHGEIWNGFECVRSLPGLPPEILLVRLPGHSAGHFGIAIQSGDKWLLHAGDAYYDRKELTAMFLAPLWTMAFERLAHADFAQAQRTKRDLKNLLHDSKIQMFCSHDPIELENLKIYSKI
jgi:glyoxylase-like metal-dependent hydrolase (beta-lactamase superfamily II)